MEPDNIRKALEKISPYPWSAWGVQNQQPSKVVTNIVDAEGNPVVRPHVGSTGLVVIKQSDLNFLLAAPKLIEDLASEIERLRKATEAK